MPETARRIVLASRPVGEPKPSDFRLEEFPVPQPGPGQVLLRTKWLSLDPYMRGRMSDAPSYAKPVGIDEVMEAGTVSEVAASNNEKYAKGDIVLSRAGWQTHMRLGRLRPAQARSEARADLHRAGRARHAGHDRLYGPARDRRSRRRARPWWCRPPPARSARWSARSPRSRGRARSASRAGRTSADTSRTSSASTTASIIAAPTCARS